MKLSGAKKQTLFLTGINGAVRAIGMVMRIWMSRLLGAEIMGIIELAQSAHMVLIAPLSSGLPTAISRLTARAPKKEKSQPLMAGLWIARVFSLVMIPAIWAFSPLLARCMGDVRVLPSLWFSAPCVLILGYSAAYNGYCYGLERSELPALSELYEQLLRFAITIAFLYFLRRLAPPWAAAVPVFATMTAEIIGVVFVIASLDSHSIGSVRNPGWISTVFQLAAPSACTRLLQTLLRSATAVLIPLRLQKSGLSAAEATAQLGMLNGMVMPLLMLPGIFTSALSMVALPKIAKAEEQPSEFRRLLKLCFLTCLPIAGFCALVIYAGAGFIALFVYRQADLIPLLRFCAPQIILTTAAQLTGSLLAATGQQRRAMYVSSITAGCTLLLTWGLAAQPDLRLYGVILAHYAGHFLSLLLGTAAMLSWRRERFHQA